VNTHFAVADRSLAFQPTSPRLTRSSNTSSAPPAPVESFQSTALADAQSFVEAAGRIEVSQLDNYKELGHGLSISVSGACLTGIAGAQLLLFITQSGSMRFGALGTPDENFFLDNQQNELQGDRSLLVELPDKSRLGVIAILNDDASETLVFTRTPQQGEGSFRAQLASSPDGRYTVTQASLLLDGSSKGVTIHEPIAANPTVQLLQSNSEPGTLTLQDVLTKTAHLLPR